jgi:hypothetical protein
MQKRIKIARTQIRARANQFPISGQHIGSRLYFFINLPLFPLSPSAQAGGDLYGQEALSFIN